MNFTEALGYSFKGQNIPKILTIVLVSIIVGVSALVAGIALESLWIMLLIIPVLLAYVLFVQGYTISVIKSVMDGDDALPEFALGRDIGRGAVVLIAGIVYMLPVIAFLVCGAILIGFVGSSSADVSSDQTGLTALMMICGMGLLFIFVVFAINFSLIVGQVRYAAENRVGALFNMSKNFGIVMSNLGTTIGLFVRMIGVAIIFGVFSSIILNVISAFFSGVTNDLVRAFDRGTFDAIASIGMPLALFASLYYIVSLTIGLMQTFSGAHLIAGFGAELGFSENKLKNDEQGSNTAVLIILGVIILLALLACAAFFVLVLMGPVIGNVFSEVIEGLG